MKFKLILVVLYLITICSCLKTKSLETLHLADTKSTVDGDFDIIEILDINDIDIDNQETRILRKKSSIKLKLVKRSDLENFEGYLDSYLNILRKFNKRISLKNDKKFTNLTFSILNKNLNKTIDKRNENIFPLANENKVFLFSS